MVSTLHEESPAYGHPRQREESRVVIGGMSWAGYVEMERLIAQQGGARLSFLDGELEIMAPLSLRHERDKKRLSTFIEQFLIRNEIVFSFWGSSSLQQESKLAGKEPDDGYCFREEPGDAPPDLAIEVNYWSGGIDSLEIYRRFGVREVLFSDRGKLSLHQLQGDAYAPVKESQFLPALPLTLLQECLDEPTDARAIARFRRSIS
jgi:Uma2 family endonuclease